MSRGEFDTGGPPEPPIEQFLRRWSGSIAIFLLVMACAFAGIGLFGKGRNAGVAFVPAMICVYLTLLPGFFLLKRWYPEKLPPDPATRSVPLLIWCQSDKDIVRDQKLQLVKTIYRFQGHDYVVSFPNQEGSHPVAVRCHRCEEQLTNTVHVRSVETRLAETGCLWTGCLFPMVTVIAILTVGSMLQNRFQLLHLIGIVVASVIVLGGLFALVARSIRRVGKSVRFEYMLEDGGRLAHHAWTSVTFGSE